MEEVDFGLLARDLEGDLIEAKTVVYHELIDPVLTESMKVKEALSWIN